MALWYASIAYQFLFYRFSYLACSILSARLSLMILSFEVCFISIDYISQTKINGTCFWVSLPSEGWPFLKEGLALFCFLKLISTRFYLFSSNLDFIFLDGLTHLLLSLSPYPQSLPPLQSPPYDFFSLNCGTRHQATYGCSTLQFKSLLLDQFPNTSPENLGTLLLIFSSLKVLFCTLPF